MKTPSKLKLGFDLVFGGFMLGIAATARPYDSGNAILAVLGLLWVFGAAVVLDGRFRRIE